jgi:hypothetical protein
MTTGLSYNGTVSGTNSYVEQLANLAVVKLNLADPTDPFTILIPQALTYAENRIYRDLDFLSTVATNTSYSLTYANRNVSVPASAFVTIQNINVITPFGATSPDTGTRNQLLPVTKEFLNATYPNSQYLAVPQYFAMLDQNAFVVGPVPDNNYQLEIVGTIRPDSLSSTNTTTFISLYLPDLLLMASMIFVSGYQRNFGRQADDPAMAQSYEGQYKTLLAGAMMEETRKKFQSSAWSSMSLPVAATPTR